MRDSPQGSVSKGSEDAAPQLRPGAIILESNENCLQIALPDHTVTLNTPTLVACAKGLLNALDGHRTAEEALALAAGHSAVSVDVARYVFDMLVNSECLYWSVDKLNANDDLATYWASNGDDPKRLSEVHERARPLAITTHRSAELIGEALADAGFRNSEIVALSATDKIGTLNNILGSTNCSLVLCWDFAYHTGVADLVNRFAATRIPALFGSCDGPVGRIGPYVLPGLTPCLTCLNSRLLSTAPAEEGIRAMAIRHRTGESAGRPHPSHPLFLLSQISQLILEASVVVRREVPNTLGAIFETDLRDKSQMRISLLRAPRCPICGPKRPPRLSWNAAFASPDVKGASSDS